MTSVTRWLMLRSRAPSISMACQLRPSSFTCVTLALSATAFCHIYFKLWAALGAAPNQAPLLEQGERARAEEPERFENLVYRALAEQLIALPRASMLLQKPARDVEIAIRGAALADADNRQ